MHNEGGSIVETGREMSSEMSESTRRRRITGRYRTLIAFLFLALGTLPAQASAVDRLRDSMRLRALELVNRDRAAHGLRPVSLDLPASLLADRFCEEQIRDSIAGHYSLDGVAPYMRYPWGGTLDMLRENVAAWSANYPFETAALPDLIGRSHRTMMEEIAPNDGHRRAILDPLATHMGFGLSWRGGELRFAQVFLRRAIHWNGSVPQSVATTSPPPVIRGRPHPGHVLEGVSMHWEPLPGRLSRSEIAARDDYRLPSSRKDYTPFSPTRQSPMAAAAKQAAAELEVAGDGSFRFQPRLDRGPGVYTTVFWTRRKGSDSVIATGLTSFRVYEPEDTAQPAR